MRLTAYIDGQRVGWFEQLATGAIALEYDPAWQSEGGRRELSWSMPKSRRKHTGAGPENYLWNLLPDNDLVLERWGRDFGVSARNPLALLARVGLDAAGAVQFVDSELHDELELRGQGGFELCSEADIAQRLRELRADPSAWVAPHASAGYFSLAGAQSKFTLLRTSAGWAVPKGTTGSTHIVKPGIPGYARSDLNEHLTMRAAALLGLRVATSRIRHFEDQSAIVVTRFDRVRREDGTVERLHQEDFAQAAGVHPARKYQDRGGPGIAQISRLVREQLGVRSDSEVRRFFEAALFDWASLSTDAHAKNYAIVYGRRSSAGRSRTRPVLARSTTSPRPLPTRGSTIAGRSWRCRFMGTTERGISGLGISSSRPKASASTPRGRSSELATWRVACRPPSTKPPRRHAWQATTRYSLRGSSTRRVSARWRS